MPTRFSLLAGANADARRHRGNRADTQQARSARPSLVGRSRLVGYRHPRPDPQIARQVRDRGVGGKLSQLGAVRGEHGAGGHPPYDLKVMAVRDRVDRSLVPMHDDSRPRRGAPGLMVLKVG